MVSAEANVVLGTDELNLEAAATASVLTAEGKTAFEFEDDGEFAIGIKGNASAAEASASVDVNALNYSEKTYDSEGKTESKDRYSLLGADLNVSARVSAGAGIWLESSTAIETEYFNVNATTFELNAKLILGVKISITVPTVYIKFDEIIDSIW